MASNTPAHPAPARRVTTAVLASGGTVQLRDWHIAGNGTAGVTASGESAWIADNDVIEFVGTVY